MPSTKQQQAAAITFCKESPKQTKVTATATVEFVDPIFYSSRESMLPSFAAAQPRPPPLIHYNDNGKKNSSNNDPSSSANTRPAFQQYYKPVPTKPVASASQPYKLQAYKPITSPGPAFMESKEGPSNDNHKKKKTHGVTDQKDDTAEVWWNKNNKDEEAKEERNEEELLAPKDTTPILMKGPPKWVALRTSQQEDEADAAAVAACMAVPADAATDVPTATMCQDSMGLKETLPNENKEKSNEEDVPTIASLAQALREVKEWKMPPINESEDKNHSNDKQAKEETTDEGPLTVPDSPTSQVPLMDQQSSQPDETPSNTAGASMVAAKAAATTDVPIYQVNLADLQPTKFALRRGQFRFNKGQLGHFLYIPDNFDFTSDDGLDSIFKSLGMPPPEMVFQFEENYSVVPNTHYADTELYWKLFPNEDYFRTWRARDDLMFPNPQRDYVRSNTMEHRVQTILDGISQACAQTSAVYLLTEPFRGNTIAEMACQSAFRVGQDRVSSLGLFTCTDFSAVQTGMEDTRSFPPLPQSMEELMQLHGVALPEEGEKKYSNDEKMKMILKREKELILKEAPGHVVPWGQRYDTRRVWIQKATFENSDYVVTQGDVPKYAIDIRTDFTESEARFHKSYRHQQIKAGLASDCSHRLVFESDYGRNRFEKFFLDRFHTGMICTGSTEKEVSVALDYFREGRPLFILENTGLAADAMASLVDFTCMIRSGRLKDQGEIDYYLEYAMPNSIMLWNQLCMCGTLWYDARVVAEAIPAIAPYINSDAHVIFDVTQNEDVSRMQDIITKAMSTPFEGATELGGVEKDLAVIHQATSIVEALKDARNRYRYHSLIFQVMIRLVIFLTVVLTVLQTTKVDEADDSYSALKVVNTILPLVGSALLAVEAAFRPAFKHAALLLAEKRVESEMYRYKTRTGVYRMKGGVAGQYKRVRAIFAENCQEIFHECMQSDLSTGTILPSSNDTAGYADGLWRVRRAQDEDDALSSNVNEKKDSTALNLDFEDEVEVVGTPVSGRSRRWRHQKDEKKNALHSRGKPKGQINDFYSVDYDYGDIIEGQKNTGRCFQRQVQETFYSRNYNHLPDEKFLAEEKKAIETIAEMKNREKGDRSSDSADVMGSQYYIENRLEYEGRKFYSQLPSLALCYRSLQVLTIMFIGAATLVVSVDKQEWVPVLVAAAAACEFASTFMNLESRIPTMNAAAGDLTNVMFWWNGLTLIQSRQPSVKDELVARSEEAILSQYEQFAGATLILARKRLAEAQQTKESDDANPSDEEANKKSNGQSERKM